MAIDVTRGQIHMVLHPKIEETYLLYKVSYFNHQKHTSCTNLGLLYIKAKNEQLFNQSTQPVRAKPLDFIYRHT